MAKSERHKFSWRKLFNDIHLWLGIASGIILFLVCLSGTIYTFRAEIEALAEPSKYHIEVEADAEPLAAEVLIEKLKQMPGGIISSITIPHAKDEPYEVSIKQSAEERRGTTYLVNPYTAEIKGTTESSASEFFMFMFRLHRWLLLDSEVGRPIVGAATIIFVFIILSGLVIWFPKKLSNWKQGLKIKFSSNWKRINHDLHNALGFYSSILLLIMALTGLCWSFEWYREGLGNVLGAQVFGGRGGGEPMTSTIPEGEASTLSVAEFIRLTDEVLPYEGNVSISLPTAPDEAVSVRKSRAASFFTLSASDRLQLDQYSGEVLQADIFSEKPLNQQITSMIKPIHTGEIFGTFSKILYFIACLIGTSLPITGVIIWINKLKKKARKKKRKETLAT